LKHNDSHLICGDNRTGKWAPPTFAASVHNELSHLRGAFKPHQRKSGLRKAAKSGGKNAKANNFAQQTRVGSYSCQFAGVAIHKVDECAPESFRRGNA